MTVTKREMECIAQVRRLLRLGNDSAAVRTCLALCYRLMSRGLRQEDVGAEIAAMFEAYANHEAQPDGDLSRLTKRGGADVEG